MKMIVCNLKNISLNDSKDTTIIFNTKTELLEFFIDTINNSKSVKPYRKQQSLDTLNKITSTIENIDLSSISDYLELALDYFNMEDQLNFNFIISLSYGYVYSKEESFKLLN